MIRKLTFVMIAGLAAAGISCTRAPVRTADSPPVAGHGVIEMSPAETRPKIEAAYSQFIDLRTKEVYDAGHAYRARNIPFDDLLTNLDKLERNEPVYLICQSGATSKKAAEMLLKPAFPKRSASRAAPLPGRPRACRCLHNRDHNYV